MARNEARNDLGMRLGMAGNEARNGLGMRLGMAWE